IVFTTMAARVGIATSESLLVTIGRKWGKTARIAIGVGVFFVCASSQAGNSIGTGTAVAEATHTSPVPWIVALNIVAIGMLFFRTFYNLLQQVMIGLLVLMLLAFVATFLLSEPSAGGMAAGLVPSVPAGSEQLVIAFMA